MTVLKLLTIITTLISSLSSKALVLVSDEFNVAVFTMLQCSMLGMIFALSLFLSLGFNFFENCLHLPSLFPCSFSESHEPENQHCRACDMHEIAISVSPTTACTS